MPKIDLHFHSNHSDGKLSVPELATIIKNNGLKYCALTDHDTVFGISELREILKGSDIIVIPGVELTAMYGDNEIHVLAYGFDVEEINDVLAERSELVKKQKIIEMQAAINLFVNEGLEIADNLLPEEKRPVGYTVAMDICKRQSNQDIFLKKFGKILTPEDIYFQYQAFGKACFLKRSGVGVEWFLEKLKGKVSDFILAHPFVQVSVATKPLSEKDIFSLLSMGMDGIEVYHYKMNDEQILVLKKIVDENNLSYTGGSDFHGHINDIDLGFYRKELEVPNFKINYYEKMINKR